MNNSEAKLDYSRAIELKCSTKNLKYKLARAQ